MNIHSHDHNPPTQLSGSDLPGTDLANRIWIPEPRVMDITLQQCLRMDCDGPKQAMFIDMDGTFTGLAPGNHIMARADFFNVQSGDNRLTHYWDEDDRKIPAKLLYDPNPSSEAPAAVARRGMEEVAAYEAPCAPDAAAYDPACRARKRIQAEVAYNGFGTYRGLPDSDTTCSLKTDWNSWHCDANVGTPARLIIESLVQAETWKVSLVPVVVAGQGFVNVHNGGSVWGRYLERRSTFYSSVYAGYDYDVAFTYTNPETLRLLLKSPNPAHRIRIGIFYSNPHRLQVAYKVSPGPHPTPDPPNSKRDPSPNPHPNPDLSLGCGRAPAEPQEDGAVRLQHTRAADAERRVRHQHVRRVANPNPNLGPSSRGSLALALSLSLTLTLPLTHTRFVAWENKIYITLCADGGDLLTEGVVIRTLPVITLWTDIERDEGVDVSTEEFFDTNTVLLALPHA